MAKNTIIKISGNKRHCRRAESTSEAFKYLLAGLASVLILIAGYIIFGMIRERMCNADLAEFESSLKGIDSRARGGQKEMQSLNAPCGSQQIYFFDMGKNINNELFNETPVLQDAVEGKGNNVFIVRENVIMRSFNAGSLEIPHPYYICFIPKFGKISFFEEGYGNSAKIEAPLEQPECTLIPVNVSKEEGDEIIEEALSKLNAIPASPVEKENVAKTMENVNIARKFSVKDKKTKVEITIKAKRGARLRNFKFYESIPKECVDDLQQYIEERTDDDAQVDVSNDPLIMWSFSEIRGEKKVSYQLGKEIDHECQRSIKGLGVAQFIESGENEGEE